MRVSKRKAILAAVLLSDSCGQSFGRGSKIAEACLAALLIYLQQGAAPCGPVYLPGNRLRAPSTALQGFGLTWLNLTEAQHCGV